MLLIPEPRRTSLAQKLAETVLAAVAVTNVLLMVAEALPPEIWSALGEAAEWAILLGPLLLALTVGGGWPFAGAGTSGAPDQPK